MKKLNNKGFTIVELVIVVAVIAILAAVLIPTVSGLIKTAQTSADVTLVKNVNLFLATERALEGKNTTMQDALEDALAGGYDIAKLTPTNSDNLILWDQESDSFVLYANEKYNSCGADVDVENLVDYQLWNIADTTEGAIHSVYYIGNETEVTVNGIGFDAGNSGVETVKYVSDGNMQDVMIHTNGGELVIEAVEDSIDHYGVANIVDVKAIANASYHEFGKATFIKVDTGRVVVESSAQIGGIHAVASGAIIATEGGATLPTVTKSSADITVEGVVETEENARNAAAEAVPPAGVARIDLKGYETLQAAVDSAEAGAKVILTKDVNMGTLWVSGGKDLTLDFNGHNIKIEKAGDYGIIISGSNLTIDGEGELVSGSQAVYCFNGGNVTINGGSYKGSNAVHLYGGNATINDGTFEGTQDGWWNATLWVEKNSNITINGGTFNINRGFSSQRIMRTDDSTIHIAGGTFNGKYSDPYESGDIYVGDSTAVMDGGLFNCSIATNYKLTVNDGTFNGQFYTSSISPTDYTLTVNGGTFNLETAQIMVGSNGWKIQINDGDFAATAESVYVKHRKAGSGVATINGGTFAGVEYTPAD